MIVRDVDVNDLSKFDFFNDSQDTARYLKSVGRPKDAEKLEIANKEWWDKEMKKYRK